MTLEERGTKRHSQLEKLTNVENTKSYLLRDLQKSSVIITGLKGNMVKDIQDLYTLNNVVTVKCV